MRAQVLGLVKIRHFRKYSLTDNLRGCGGSYVNHHASCHQDHSSRAKGRKDKGVVKEVEGGKTCHHRP